MFFKHIRLSLRHHRSPDFCTMMESSERNSNSNSNHSSVSNQETSKPDTDNKENSNQQHKRKLKILAFHGYRQNGAIFRSKIGSFRKAVSKYAQLTFFSAPHRVISEDGAGDDGNGSSETSLFNTIPFHPVSIIKSIPHCLCGVAV